MLQLKTFREAEKIAQRKVSVKLALKDSPKNNLAQ